MPKSSILGITSYWTEQEKKEIEKQALSRNQSLSTWIKTIILGHLNNAPDIPPSWIEKAKENQFVDIMDFLNTAVNAYNIPVSSSSVVDEKLQSEISRLKNENKKFQSEIISLKAPKITFNQLIKAAKARDKLSYEILNILFDAKGKYISVDELCEMLEVRDEQDYLLFLEAIRELENVEFNIRNGYRLVQV